MTRKKEPMKIPAWWKRDMRHAHYLVLRSEKYDVGDRRKFWKKVDKKHYFRKLLCPGGGGPVLRYGTIHCRMHRKPRGGKVD